MSTAANKLSSSILGAPRSSTERSAATTPHATSSSHSGTSSPSYSISIESIHFREQSRFKPSNTCSDLWVSILFYIQLIAYYGTIIYLVHFQYSSSSGSSMTGKGSLLSTLGSSHQSYRDLLSFLFPNFKFVPMTEKIKMEMSSFFLGSQVSICISGVITFAFMLLSIYRPVSFMRVSYFTLLIWVAIISLGFLVSGGLIEAAIGSLICLIMGVFHLSSREGIPFSTVILKNIVEMARSHPLFFWPSFIGFVLQLVIFGFLMNALPVLATIILNNVAIKPAATYGIMAFLLASLFWQIGTILNCIQTFVAGLVMSILLKFDRQSTRSIKSILAKRIIITSFGSIALGSLLAPIAVIAKFIVFIVGNDESNLSFAATSYIARPIRWLMEHFNCYAYTLIAIYGNSYIDSSKESYRLVRERNADKMIDNNLISRMFAWIAIISGLTCGLAQLSPIGAKLSGIHNESFGSPMFILFVISTGLIGTFTSLTLSKVFGSAATSIFVCYAEEPQSIQNENHELFQELRTRDLDYV